MVPKVQGPDQVAFVHHLLTQLEAELGMSKRIGLELQIESARGAENLPAIADASDRIETIIFGPGDYAADLGIPQLSVGGIDERVSRRPVALHPLAHRDHRAGARPAGDRRAVLGDPDVDGFRTVGRALGAGSVATANGRCTRRRSRSSTRSTGPRRSSTTGPRRCSPPIARDDRGRAPRRRHVGGRDDRRGLAQDGRAGGGARPRGRHVAAWLASVARRAWPGRRTRSRAAAATDTCASTKPHGSWLCHWYSPIAACSGTGRAARARGPRQRSGRHGPNCRTSSSTAATMMYVVATRTCT